MGTVPLARTEFFFILGKTTSHHSDPLASTGNIPGLLAQKLRDGSTFHSPFHYLCPPHTLSVVDILVSLEFYLSMDLDQDLNWKTILVIKRPNGLASSLLIMLIIPCRYSNLGLKEASFRDFKDFVDFEAVFHKIFMGLRYLVFTKSGAPTVIFVHALNTLKHLDSRFLLGASRPLFCIMHALLLSTN
jgi:hypothetical protein